MQVTIERKRISLFWWPLIILPMLSWPSMIGYLFYLGITDSWISEKFFHWEGISLIIVAPWIFYTSFVGAYLTSLFD